MASMVLDEEMNVVEDNRGKDENMNNEDYAKGTGVRKKDNAVNTEDPQNKRRSFQNYLYHQDYQEALRSLLWEPYDCRENNREGVPDEEEEQDENWCLLVPQRKMSSSSSGSATSDEGVRKRISWPVMDSRRRRPLSEPACDLVREQMDGLVRDPASTWIHRQSALRPDSTKTPQSEWNRRAERSSAGPLDMSVSVPGTLDPPDASDSTRLVENPGRLPTSSGNVSVVNCYRAVPVAVVSSVPTIKCLNTQDNVVQTYVRPPRNPPPVPGTSKPRPKQPPRPVSALFPRETPETLLSNHSRSVSNPVLGQNPTRPSPSRFGSQQNLPIRLETHFGENVDQAHTFSSNSRPPPPQEVNVVITNPPVEPPKPRTFTSTEAQTDDIGVPCVPLRTINREQRRRERRERRHQRRIQQSMLGEFTSLCRAPTHPPSGEGRLPDILHSHLPPPYVAGAASPPPLPTVQVPPPMPVVPPPIQHIFDPTLVPPGHPSGLGFPFPFTSSRR